jgi:predicted nucleic acid-binding protein
MAEITHLVDTPILVDFFRGSEKSKTWLEGFSSGELAISVITAVELIAGCRNQREQKQVEKDLELYPMILVSSTISATAWEWYRKYRLSHGVGFLDCLIGATAYTMGVTLCTLNDKHFRPLPGVEIERPY